MLKADTMTTMPEPEATDLNLWKKQLGRVPDWVWERTELETLVLADNGLTEISERIGELHARPRTQSAPAASRRNGRSRWTQRLSLSSRQSIDFDPSIDGKAEEAEISESQRECAFGFSGGSLRHDWANRVAAH